MMNWEQGDKLNEIAVDQTKSADDRKSEILRFMQAWGELVNCRACLPCNYALTSEPVIDPSKESVKAKLSLVGQTGRTYYPGY